MGAEDTEGSDVLGLRGCSPGSRGLPVLGPAQDGTREGAPVNHQVEEERVAAAGVRVADVARHLILTAARIGAKRSASQMMRTKKASG